MNKFHIFVLIWSTTLFLLPQLTLAVLPPDLIVSAGTQVIQLFAVLGILGAALLSSLILGYRTIKSFILKYSTSVIIITAAAAICGTLLYSIFLYQKQQLTLTETLSQAEEEILRLHGQLVNSYSSDQLNDYINHCTKAVATSTTSGSVTPFRSCEAGHYFISDTVTVYADLPSGPLVFEIDLNRLEKVSDVYSQYFFFNAFVNGREYADYHEALSTTSSVVAGGFLKSFEKVQASDQSTRSTYEITVAIAGELYTIRINDVNGDFITRDTPDYTRFHSVGAATVAFGGNEYRANAFVENLYSFEYHTKIFFLGRDNLKATTHQFVLWDEQNNFYLFDSTKTTTDVAAYRPHTWLLFKDAKTNQTKKAFSGSLDERITSTGSAIWKLQLPDFNNAEVTMETTQVFKDEGERKRQVVSGTVSDNFGTRHISGIAHIIE